MNEEQQPDFPWSYSHLEAFELCPRKWAAQKYYKQYEDKQNAAGKRGQSAHRSIELFLEGVGDLPLDLEHHRGDLERIRNRDEIVLGEQKIGLTKDLKPIGFFDDEIWFRAIVDYLGLTADKSAAHIIDWKFGKRKPVKDKYWDQIDLCAAAVARVLPSVQILVGGYYWARSAPGTREHIRLYARGPAMELDKVKTNNPYDLDKIFFDFRPRIDLMQAAIRQEVFPAKPNFLCHKYCPVDSCQFHGTAQYGD